MENEGIAIIGMSGRFPGANNLEEYWKNLKEGKDCITYFTKEDAKDAGVKKEDYNHKNYVFAGGILENVEYFDEVFFGMSPREAANMDPQQRLFLECSYEALEDAGYAKDEYKEPVGVFAGANMSTYFLYHLADKIGVKDDFSLTVGNDKDYIATRTSYMFNLKGPSISVQTACSTSMTAVAMACDSLDSFQCDMAIAGGAAVKLPQKMGYLYQEGMIASPDGCTRPFDEEGAGTVFTSVAGVVILKRYEDALRDHDHIYAVIKGISMNNDGSEKVGFTAPSREGQANVVETAQYLAEVNPEEVGYIEAHGTGTKLGDPIEVSALTKVFEKSTKKKGYCAIGSVKGNIGHSVSGSGIAGLIKTALVVKNGQIPPSIHFEYPNQEIDFIDSPFYVNSKLRDWENNQKPRIAGVSSFGFGGTNVHAVLQEATESKQDRGSKSSERRYYVVTLSARSETSLNKMRQHLGRYLRKQKTQRFEDVVYTLHIGRKNFEHRLAFVCNSRLEAIEMLFDVEHNHVLIKTSKKKETICQINAQVLEEAKLGQKEALQALAEYWVQGGMIDWEAFEGDTTCNKVALPTYSYDRKRHWVEPYHKKEDTVKQTSPKEAVRIEDWLYRMNWERKELTNQGNIKKVNGSYWIVFMDNLGFGTECCQTLTQAGASVLKVYPGRRFEEIEQGMYQIDMYRKEDYEKLFTYALKEKGKECYLLHLWNLTEPTGKLIAPDEIDESMYKSFYSLLFIAQTWEALETKKKIHLSVITNHMHLIANETSLQPEKSLVLGPVKVIPKEHTQIICQSIDLDTTKENLYQNKSLLSNLLEEIIAEKPEYMVAYRGRFRFLPTSEPLILSDYSQSEYRKEGATYVITGGFGGIGFELAKQLARVRDVRLVLIGRRSLLEVEEKLQILENLGAIVMYVCADCTKSDDMIPVYKKVSEKFGEVSGIFHAAGSVDTNELINKTVESTNRVLSAKVKGTLVLDEWIRLCHPKFVVLFSSISGILGTAGLIDYSSANSFLDSYALYHYSQNHTNVISIDWDGWDNVGMVASTEEGLQHKLKGNLQVSDGLYLLDNIIRASLAPQVVVSKQHFPTMLSKIRQFMRGETLKTAKNSRVQREENRPDLETAYVAPQNSIQQKITQIWEEMLGVYPIGIQDDYFELGGHSMLAVEIVAKMDGAFQKKIALRELFERSNIEQVSHFYEVEE